MTTVGEILSNARNRKKLTLEQVEKATKIRLKFLVAIEQDELNKLPPGTFTKGFIKNYAAFLGLPVNETMAFYRRQVNEDKGPALPAKPSAAPSKSGFSPPSFTAIGAILFVIVFFIYLAYSYFRYAGSPALTITSPAKNAVVNEEQVEITGKTDSDAQLTVNNQPIALNKDGSFSTKITLTPGINTLTVISTNKFRRQSTVVRNLRLEK